MHHRVCISESVCVCVCACSRTCTNVFVCVRQCKRVNVSVCIRVPVRVYTCSSVSGSRLDDVSPTPHQTRPGYGGGFDFRYRPPPHPTPPSHQRPFAVQFVGSERGGVNKRDSRVFVFDFDGKKKKNLDDSTPGPVYNTRI